MKYVRIGGNTHFYKGDERKGVYHADTEAVITFDCNGYSVTVGLANHPTEAAEMIEKWHDENK